MKTKFNFIANDWKRIKNHCRTADNKEFTENNATEMFKKKLLISEHSPIRLLEFDWSWKQIPCWVSTEWSRHKFEKFISAQRDACSIGQNGCCDRPVLLQAGTFSPATEKGFAGVLGGHEVISETYNIDYMEDMGKYGWNKNSAPFPSMVVVFRPKIEMLEGME